MMGPTARYLLRCILYGVAAAQASLLTVALASGGIDQNDGVIAILLAIGASLAYAGIGAAVPQVEPKIGNKLEA